MNAPAPLFDPEDPRLTAYALGELTDPADHAAVERTLQSSPEARAALQEIRGLTAALVAEYEQERLLAAGNDVAPPKVVAMVPGGRTVPRSWPRRLLLAAAAVLLLASVAPLMVSRWQAAIHPPKSAFHSSSAVVDNADAPANAKIVPPAAPVTLAAEPPPIPPMAASPAPSLSGLVADASARSEGSSMEDRARAPSTPTRALDGLTKDDLGQTKAAKPSKALALNAPPLSQGGLGGEPVASAPSTVFQSLQRRAVASDKRSGTRLIQHAENPFVSARDHPLSTFSFGTDVAGEAYVRRSIESGHLPPPYAVEAGEWINAFLYNDPAPAPGDTRPFAVRLEAAACPWNARNRLVRIGITGRAGDATIQVKFNPAAVATYRLVGAGNDTDQHLTALYETVPADQSAPGLASLTVELLYKAQERDHNEQSDEETLTDHGTPGDLASASPDFKFAAAVASFAQILRDSPYRGDATLETTIALARQGIGNDPDGRRTGFVELVQQAQTLRKTPGR